MKRIDVHSHAIPPKYRKYMLESGFDQPDGIAEIPG
jgi:6-methylsalicylate decarboxylase